MTQQSPQWAPLPMPPQPPGGFGAGNYGGPPMMTPPPPQKPSGMYKALGIVQIVLGIGGVLYAFISVATTAFASAYASSGTLYDAPTLAFAYVHAAASVLSGSLLIATGVGIVRARRWSRMVGLGYAGVSLVETWGGALINVVFIQPHVYAKMGPAVAGMAKSIEMISIVSIALGVLVMSILPVFTLIALLRARAREELDQ